MKPVYFAVSHGKEDWERIYSLDQKEVAEFTSVDYPGAYENVTANETAEETDKQTFRANQKDQKNN